MTAQPEALGRPHHGRCCGGGGDGRRHFPPGGRRREQLAMAREDQSAPPPVRGGGGEGCAHGDLVVYSRRTKRRQQGAPDQGAAAGSSRRVADLDRSPPPPATCGGGRGAGEPSPSTSRKKRRRGSPLLEGKSDEGENTGAAVGCTDCGASQSPMWRKGPAGPKTLCNACGIRYAKAKRRRTHLEELLQKLRETVLTPAPHSGEEDVEAALILMAFSSEHLLNASQKR